MTTPEVDSELERLFGVARRETLPDADARARIRAGLALQLSTSVPPTPTTSARHAWLGAGVAALALGGVALWLNSAPPSRPLVSSPALPPSAPFAPGAPAPPVSLEVTPPVAPTPSVAAPAAKAPAIKPPVASAKPPSSATPPADPAEELTLVRSMQQALRAGNASQALTLAAEHARRFPSGALVEEREGVRAVAQCRLAAPEARAALLSAFTRRFGSSPYAARVKAACQ